MTVVWRAEQARRWRGPVLALSVLLAVAATAGIAVGEPSIDSDAAARRLGEAVRYRTISIEGGGISDAGEFERFRDYLRRAFPVVHAKLRVETIAEHSLLYSWGEGEGSPVLLAAHQDVVPVEESKWTQPPFEGRLDESFVWGRGTLDDKGSLLGLLEAVELLAARGFQPRRRVYLAFGHDEEKDGAGAMAIAAELARRGERLEMVLDEGGFVLDGVIANVERGVATVGVAEKGYLTVELSAVGGGGHSSVPPRTTAVGRIARAVARLEENPMPSRLEPVVLRQLRAISSELSWTERLALSQPWLFGSVVRGAMDSRQATAATIRTTTAATVIDGGLKGNVLPRRARALVNFRILPGDTVDEVMEHVRNTVDDPEVSIRPTGTPTEPSPVSSADSAAFVAISDSIAEEFPDALVAPSLVLGMTDSRHYQSVADNVYRFLPLRFDPADIERMHGVDERISIEAYAGMIRFYARLIERLAAPVP